MADLRFKLIIFLSCCSSLSLAQIDFSGKVVDESGAAIDGVEILLINSGERTSTNELGNFNFEVKNPGVYQLVGFAFGYEKFEKSIEINQDLEYNFSLVELTENLSELEFISREKQDFNLRRLNPVEGMSIYSGKKNEVIMVDQLTANKASNNARQVYAQIVGLNIYENGDGGLQLNIGGRGLDPNRSSNFNTRQNGYDISADVLGYPESYYTPPAEALNQIQVVRGAASLQYGTQFGGLINFKMKTPPLDKKIQLVTRQSAGSFNAFSSFNSLGGSLGKFSYYTYYNGKKSDGFRPNASYYSHNAYSFLQYKFNYKTSISLEYTHLSYLAQQAGGLSDTQFNIDHRFSNRTRNWFDVDWNLAALKFNHSFSNNVKIEAMLFGLLADRKSLGYRGNPINLNNNPISEEDYVDENGDFIFNRDLIFGTFKNYGAEFRLLNPYKIKSKDLILLLGSKFYRSQNTSRQGPGTIGTNADFNFQNELYPDYSNQSDFKFPNLNVAIFGENIFFINEKLSVTPGFRFEHIITESNGYYKQIIFDNAQNPISNVELRDDRLFDRSIFLLGLGMSYLMNINNEWYANFSQNYRSVTFSDIRTTSPTFIVDPDIRDERGFTTDLGLRSLDQQTISYDLSVFGLFYDDRIGIIFDDRANRVRKNIGTAFIYGLEMFGEINLIEIIKSESSEVKAGIFINTAITRSSYLRSEENNVEGKQVEFIPKLNFKTGINFGYKNFSGSLQWIYLSEQYTDVENSSIAIEGDMRNGLIGQIPKYDVMDLSLSYLMGRFKLETGINNLLDEKYFTRRAISYPGPGIIPSDSRSFYSTLQVKF